MHCKSLTPHSAKTDTDRVMRIRMRERERESLSLHQGGLSPEQSDCLLGRKEGSEEGRMGERASAASGTKGEMEERKAGMRR